MTEYFSKNVSWAFRSLYLHGSLSTMDYVKGVSDFDTFGILRKEVVCSSESLLKIRKDIQKIWSFLYKIDPLQHHGINLISEQDMNFYPQHFFPLNLLNFSTTLWTLNNDILIFY